MSRPNYQSNQVMVGNGKLPLIPSSRWRGIGHEYWTARGIDYWTAARSLERIQHLLDEERQEENTVILKSAHKPLYWRSSYISNPKIPFHPDIKANWDAFVESQQSRGALERFRIDNIVLPPSPFFTEKLVPLFNELTSLELHSCDLGSSDILSIAQLLSENSRLTTLDISSNEISDVDSANALALAMKSHPNLCFANLSDCGLGVGSVDRLKSLLDGALNLKTLLIEKNNIVSAEGVALVAAFLSSEPCSATVFSLYENEVGDEQADVLSKALKKNTKLRSLCLGSSNISLPTFIGSKRATKNLLHIDLSTNWYCRNKIKTQGGKLIAEYLEKNPVVQELNLKGHSINATVGKLLAAAVKTNTNLQHLNLRLNNLSDKCVPEFVDALRNNNTLLSLDLSGNNIKMLTGRKQLLNNAICNTTSLRAVAEESNHTCRLILCEARYRNDLTREEEMKSINSLDNDGQKIRFKVSLALFTLETDLFHPRNFLDVPLELMPRLIELAQQEIGFQGFGEGIVEKTRKRRPNGKDPTLRRVYTVIQGWNIPLLVMRGPGKLRKKRKRKATDDEEWTPTSRGSGW